MSTLFYWSCAFIASRPHPLCLRYSIGPVPSVRHVHTLCVYVILLALCLQSLCHVHTLRVHFILLAAFSVSRPHPLCLFSEVASRLSSSGVPSRDFHHNFRSYCALTVIIFRHLNCSFYLLTYCMYVCVCVSYFKNAVITFSKQVSAVQGHPRSLILVPIESAYASCYYATFY